MTENQKRLTELKKEEAALLYLIDLHNIQKHLFSMNEKELAEYNDAVLDELNEIRKKIRTIEKSENL
jgi:hypothetical protein